MPGALLWNIETVIPQGDDYSQLRPRHGELVEPLLVGAISARFMTDAGPLSGSGRAGLD